MYTHREGERHPRLSQMLSLALSDCLATQVIVYLSDWKSKYSNPDMIFNAPTRLAH